MIAAILLLAAAAAPFVSRRLTGDLFHPAAIVAAVWGGTIGLLLLGWLPYVAVTPTAWQLLAAAIGVLLVGILAGQFMARAWADPRIVLPQRPDHWVLAYSVLAYVGLAWYVYAVVSRFGWIFDDGLRLRALLNALEIPSTYLFLQQFCTAAGLLAWGLWLGGAPLRRTTLVAALCASAGTLLTTDRTQFFGLVITGAFMFLLAHGRRVRLSRLLPLAGAALLLLTVNFLVVGAWTGKSAGAAGVRLRWPGTTTDSLGDRLVNNLQAGAMIYIYATGSYPALSEYLKEPRPRTHGTHVVYPVARLLQRTGLVRLDLPPSIPAFVPIATREDGLPLATNAYTFLYYPLEDFGPWGAVAYAALIGLLSGAAYGWVRSARTSPARLLLMGQVSNAIALTFFVNKFNNTAWWYVLVLTLVPFAMTALASRMAWTVGRAGPRGAGLLVARTRGPD